MSKHILGQAMYQIAIMCLFFFYGEHFLIEEFDDAQKRDGTDYVKSGLESKGYDYDNLGPSRHTTYNFNVFVIMTLFNFINARKLNDECNTLKGICNSNIFFIVIITILVLQFTMLTFGRVAFKVHAWVSFEFNSGIRAYWVGYLLWFRYAWDAYECSDQNVQ